MTSKQRLKTALSGGAPDRLPVTTHHVLPYYLDRSLEGRPAECFFEEFGLDAIRWVTPHRPRPGSGDYPDPLQSAPGFLESRRSANDDWRVYERDVSTSGRKLTRYEFATPGGTLSMVIEAAPSTSWVVEPLIKGKTDIEIIGRFVTSPVCDVEAVNGAADEFGERGIIRGHICCFDVFGQPGCWQDAACLVGAEKLVLAAADDPEWVDELLRILQRRKLTFVQSLAGARYDVLELGGGDGSASVVSPRLFDRFVAPYDAELIRCAHEAGQRIVYHLCGRIMPLIDSVLEMRPDAIETFTPREMGGDANLAEAKRKIRGRACMIGGFDQLHFFTGCAPETTRAEVRRCFEEAGEGGGFILSPSDHFFEAEPALLHAYADEARRCVYQTEAGTVRPTPGP